MPSFKLAASLALSGHDAEARETSGRYLYYGRLYEGLRKAGLLEE
jgi:hypothetical protein